MLRVLFVCLGNICRSPMADAIFRKMVADAGLVGSIMVDSAGTGGWHVGETAHPRTLGLLRQHHIPYDGRARQFQRSDPEVFNYVLAMDRSNLRDIRIIGGPAKAEISLFLHYAKEAGAVKNDEVPDPYYSGEYEYVYELVSAGSRALLDHIRREHKL